MLALARQLRDIDSDIAPDGLRERSLRTELINDDFDLAEALLRSESLHAAVRALTREQLAVLRGVQSGLDSEPQLAERIGDGASAALRLCASRFLVHSEGGRYTAFPEVVQELDRLAIGPLDELVAAAAPTAVALHPIDTSLIDRRAAERALRTCSALSELLLCLRTEPARQLAKGGLALPDLKRIAAAARIELNEVDAIHRLASQAGLIFCDGNEWFPTVEANHWLSADIPHRWASIALAWWDTVPEEIRACAGLLVREPPHDAPSVVRLSQLLAWNFPALDEAADAFSAFTRDGEVAGLLVGQEFSAIGRAIASGGAALECEQVAKALLPSEVTQFYVQPDSSIVVPGPAAASIDRMLRRIADVEHADLASTFRMNEGSLYRGLASGLTIPEIRSFLSEHSLSGIPQPIEFLLTEAAAQFGRIRVREIDQPPACTAIRALDRHDIDVLRVDQALSAFGLTLVGDELHTRVGATHVLLMLEAAKYPAALEDADGEIIPLRAHVARATDLALVIDPIQAMWDRVRSARSLATDASAWLSRQIQSAVKSKTTLIVEVRLPNDGRAEYVLEPTGFAGNRLRGRDRKSDIERTLPLSSILSMRPASS
ncbi:MAG: helicase-associated domain-containing protein [Agromyces sp.]